MTWNRSEIETDQGIEEAIEPLVVSASRATDIPAFYSRWFMNRLKAGYLRWTNPFNNRSMTVSLRAMKACVFWTKNPEPMMEFLPELDRLNLAYYFQFTLNDYEKENLEPNVPPLADRLHTFQRLSERIGPHRVIWRFDPLILTQSLDMTTLIERISFIGDRIHSSTRRLVFSFADIAEYAKVQRNLRRAGIAWEQWDQASMKHIAGRIAEKCGEWGLEAATCAEDLALEELGIQHNQCVDPKLLAGITNDTELLQFLGYRQGMFGPEPVGKSKKLKDTGQRMACGCMVSKDIGQYNTCPHLCRYCYANASESTALDNYRFSDIHSGSIVSNRIPRRTEETHFRSIDD